jgi:hypothetical protein
MLQIGQLRGGVAPVRIAARMQYRVPPYVITKSRDSIRTLPARAG